MSIRDEEGHTKIIRAALALILVGATISCTSTPGGTLTGEVPNPPTSSSVASTPPSSAPTPRMSFTNANWALAVTDASQYKGADVLIYGKIFLDPERSADQLAFQMYVDAANSGQNTAVGGVAPTLDVKRGDYVKVIGTVYDMLEGKNAFGATLRIPLVRAISVEKVTRAEVVAPTLKTVVVNQAMRQYAVTLTLQKIEFASTETRFFVRVENAGPAKANVYAFEAIVVQGTKQLKTKTSFDSGYPDIPSGLIGGVVAETVLLFDPMEMTSLRFIWQASSDNFSQRFADYLWSVTVP